MPDVPKDAFWSWGFHETFIIVVPSVAIREGVLKNLDITKEHFKALYSTEPEYFVYDAKKQCLVHRVVNEMPPSTVYLGRRST